jgi:hypothetical protein
MEFRFALRDNGMRAAFQLLHMVLEVCLFILLHNTPLPCCREVAFSKQRMSNTPLCVTA